MKVFDSQTAKSRSIRASLLPVEGFLKLDPFCDRVVLTVLFNPEMSALGGRISLLG